MKLQIKLPMGELRKRSIFLATPMYGGQNAGMFNRSMTDLSSLCSQNKIELRIYYLFNESLITRARNYCCDEFMRSGCTHLLFIDSDIGFNPGDVLAMLALQGDESPYDVISAPYAKKCISWEKIRTAVNKGMAEENPNVLDKYVGDYVFNPRAGTKAIPIYQPVEVMEAGTGFMMIRRKTFEVFQEKYPSLWYRPDHVRTDAFDGSREIMAYFDCIIDRGYYFGDVHNIMKGLANGSITAEEGKEKLTEFVKREEKASKRYLSEDYNFCYMAWNAGLKVWLCPWMQLQHAGTFIFGGSLADLATLGVSATADIGELQKIKDANKEREKGINTHGPLQRPTRPVGQPVQPGSGVLPGLPKGSPLPRAGHGLSPVVPPGPTPAPSPSQEGKKEVVGSEASG